jgi:hypothetical protein
LLAASRQNAQHSTGPRSPAAKQNSKLNALKHGAYVRYAEKANEESAAIEREACLAPEGETWSMMLRQEGALDRSIDRKVRILLRLRKESTNLPAAPAGQDDGAGMVSIEASLDSDIPSETSQSVEAVGNLKKVLQQNLWVASGSGRAPRVW